MAGFRVSHDLETEGWEFAVKCDALYQAGMSAIDLRWLISRGYVEYALTTALPGGQEQLSDKNLPFEERDTCFILTNSGAALAIQVLTRTLQPVSHMPSENRKAGQAGELSGHLVVEPRLVKQRPSWDCDRKELRFREWVIKQFRWPAVNQETVLMAFEEEDWPARIDDPLPPKVNQDPKHRLHDTIKCLNRNHMKPVIRFNGDGTGEGILWTFRECAEFDT